MESNERVEVILDLFREGHSAEEIADLLGYKGKGGVSGYMRRHGYRFDWTIKNYMKDPLMKPNEPSFFRTSCLQMATYNHQEMEIDQQVQAMCYKKMARQ